MAQFRIDKRLGWRVLGFFILIFVVYWLLNVALGVGPNWIVRKLEVSPSVRTYVGSTLSYGGRLAALIFLSCWGVSRVLRRSPRDLMFPTLPGWWKGLVFGLVTSMAGMSLLFLLEVRAGWLVVDGWQWQEMALAAWIRNLWLALLINATVAIGEEALFRGYLLTGFVQAWGAGAGVLVMALLFASFHLLAKGAEETSWFLFILLLSLPGFMLAWAYLRSGSLWLSIGIHFGWNLMEDEVFNLHGRGVPQLVGAVTHQQGPPWLVGTSYGIEVGVAGVLLAVLISAGVLLSTRQKRAVSGI